MNNLTFAHIERTGLSKDQVIAAAQALKKAMEQRFGKNACTLQQAVDNVIDSAIEHNQ